MPEKKAGDSNSKGTLDELGDHAEVSVSIAQRSLLPEKSFIRAAERTWLAMPGGDRL